MTTTKVMRDHPDVEHIEKMSTAALWRYTLDEVAFLTSPEQRRIPQPVEAAIRELHKRRK